MDTAASRLARIASPAAVAAVVLAATAAVWLLDRDAAAHLRAAAVQREAGRIERIISDRLKTYQTVLLGARGLFLDGSAMTAEEWRAYAQLLDFEDRFTDVHGMAFAPYEPGPPPSVALAFVEPARKAGGAVGNELLSDPGRIDLIERARDGGAPVLSARLTLKDAVDAGPALVHVLAVYQPGAPIETVEQRRQAFRGVVAVAHYLEPLLRSALEQVPDALLVRLEDVSAPADRRLLAERGDWSQVPRGEALGVVVAAADRRWALYVYSRGDLVPGPFGRWQTPLIVGAGVALAFAGAAAVWLLLGRRSRAQALAARMTTALAASEQRYRQLFVGNRAVQLLIDPGDGGILDANRAAERFYGWPVDVLRTMSIQDINSLAPEEVVREMERASAERRDHFYFRHRRADGSLRDVEVHSGPIDVDGRRVLYSIVHDITERKLAERALEASELRFRTLFEESPLAIQVLSADGRTVRVNRAWETMWGISSAKAIAAGLSMLDDPQFHTLGVADVLRRALAGERIEAAAFRYEMAGPPRRGVWLRLFAYPTQGEAGAVEEVIVVYTDVTEERHREARLQRTLAEVERSNADLEQFAYVASHDMQEPLRMVSSYVSLIDRRYGDKLDQDGREFIRFAVDGARRMQNLIHDLLDYARVQRQGKDPAPVEADLALQAALVNLRTAIEETGAEIVHDPLPLVEGDDAQLVRLFQNLIGNAIKYRRADEVPRVHVSAKRDGDSWRFTVRDNGIGIAPEYHERIFGIFQRLHPAEQYGGTGVGLAICRRIVERHGGALGVDSAEGEGATFWFTIPAIVPPGIHPLSDTIFAGGSGAGLAAGRSVR